MTTSSIFPEMYLISYGASGTLGCFQAASHTEHYAHGTQVMVRTERGKETGTVLCLSDSHRLPVGLELHPGLILGYYQQQEEEAEQLRLSRLGQQVFNAAQQIVNELFLPTKLIDVETVSDPDTVVLHLLLFGQVELNALQTRLAELFQVQILLHDVTNPEALEEVTASGCDSCSSSGGCGSGGCESGSCSSNSSPQKFQNDWQDYFAELRQKMERRHE